MHNSINTLIVHARMHNEFIFDMEHLGILYKVRNEQVQVLV